MLRLVVSRTVYKTGRDTVEASGANTGEKSIFKKVRGARDKSCTTPAAPTTPGERL